MIQDVTGLFGSIADVFKAIKDFWNDLADRCKGHWAVGWMEGSFRVVANYFHGLEIAFKFVDSWATAVVDEILNRIRYNELRQKVKGISRHIKDIIENPGFWLRWQIGKELGLAWWQRITWSQLPFYILKIHTKPVWDIWQRPKSTIRGWIQTYLLFLYQLYQDPLRRIRDKVGEILGFSAWETRHPEWWIDFLLYRVWPDWFELKKDPANYIKWRIYAKWPSLMGLFGFPKSWIKQKLTDILVLPVGFWAEWPDSLVWLILERIENRLDRYTDRIAQIGERLLLKIW